MKFLLLTICIGLLLFPVFTQTTKTTKADPKKSAKKPTPIKTSATKSKPPTKKPSDAKNGGKPKLPPEKKTDAKSAASKPKASTEKKSNTKTTSAKNKSSAATSKTASVKPKPKPKTATEKPVDDKAEFEKAVAVEDTIEKINSLRKFLAGFPKSDYRMRALELLAATAASVADEKFRAGDTQTALALYKLAADSSPSPIPEKLFTDAISKIPNSLYWSGSRVEALDIAKTIERKIDTNAAQLLNLATFYVSIESGDNAVRLSKKAVQLEPASSNAYQTLGLAHRVNFQLEESAAAYAKAVELDAESVNARRSLAEMKRALGKSDEAVALYQEILARDDANIPARTGLILSLFDAGKKADAESEMAKSLEQNPNNLILLAGAAYWYAAHNDGAKAVDIAQKAVANEPRYIWSHIALGRGLMSQNRPLEAEEALLKARQYGNFPTLEYEIASARFMAGFYREAAEELSKSFLVADGSVQTRLGGRVVKADKNFTDLLAYERKASTLEPSAADDPEIAAQLKALLEFSQKLKDNAKEDEIAAAADAFIGISDKMKFHRELYAASALLDKKIALAKVLDLTKSAVGNTDAALDIPNAGAAVMASELYESRTTALSRNEFIRVPDVPRQTLSAILRGRIEEIAGWVLYNQNNYPEAVIRLRRAVSVMPDKSSWWRSSMWRLGAALQADGKEKEALDSYIRSYKIDKPDMVRYSTIEALYKKLNGSADGLEAKIGPSPLQAISTITVAQMAEPTPTPAPKIETAPEPKAEPTPEPSLEVALDKPKIEPAPKTEPSPRFTPSLTPVVESTPQPTPEAIVTPLPTPKTQVTEKTNSAITEDKPVSDPSKATETKNELFKPIVITIPPLDSPKSEQKTARIEPEPIPSPSPSETAKTEEPKIEKPAPDEKKPDEPTAGETRPRVVEGKEIQSVDVPKCSITATQETISLLNNGGSIGILIGIEDEGGDIKKIKAGSNSPDDIQISLEPEIAGVAGRAFYVIKSVSPKMGVYKVMFELPCGKKEITVTVR